MNITLFTPSSHQCYGNIIRSAKRQPTLGPAYLAGALIRAGYKVNYVDGDALDLIGPQAIEDILKNDPGMVGVSLTTPLFSETVVICRLLREAGYKGHITLGGAHPTDVPDESLQFIPEADSVVLGEADDGIVLLADALKNKTAMDEIPSLVYRSGQDPKKIVGDRVPRFIEKLDELALPALETYPMHRYISPMWSDNGAEKLGSMITTRGCPFKCEYCASGGESWGTLRYHSVDRVMVEIRRLKYDYNVDYIVFNDDTFTVNAKRCIEICRRMEEEKIDLPFMVQSRVDTVHPELLEGLKKGGCFLITYGIESGNNEVLKTIGKHITVEKTREAIAWTKEHGIKTVGNYMFGHWPDTHDTCQQTLDLALEMDCDISQFAISIPYPGTVLHTMAMAENRIYPTKDYGNFGYYGNAPWKHPNLSGDELIALQQKAYKLTQETSSAASTSCSS